MAQVLANAGKSLKFQGFSFFLHLEIYSFSFVLDYFFTAEADIVLKF